MKLITGYCIFTLVLLLAFTCSSNAETVYVNGIMKITMRTGPGQNHKIVAMLKSGDSLELLDNKNGWSLVKADNGKQGWVLTRFITKNMPVVLMVNKLKDQNKVLSEALDKLKQQNKVLSEQAKQSKIIEESYYRLKKESANFLSLEKKYKKTAVSFKKQQKRIAFLEKQLRNEDIKWFLSGSGVLLIGIFLGISAGRKRKSSLL